eukprot:2338051-Prorocentrum_lima.AAC.1
MFQRVGLELLLKLKTWSTGCGSAAATTPSRRHQAQRRGKKGKGRGGEKVAEARRAKEGARTRACISTSHAVGT